MKRLIKRTIQANNVGKMKNDAQQAHDLCAKILQTFTSTPWQENFHSIVLNGNYELGNSMALTLDSLCEDWEKVKQIKEKLREHLTTGELRSLELSVSQFTGSSGDMFSALASNFNQSDYDNKVDKMKNLSNSIKKFIAKDRSEIPKGLDKSTYGRFVKASDILRVTIELYISELIKKLKILIMLYEHW